MQSFLVSQPVINFFRYALFFAILILHSHLVFAQDPAPSPACGITANTCRSAGEILSQSNACYNNGAGWHWLTGSGDGCPYSGSIRGNCVKNCTCPAPYVFTQYLDSDGNRTSGCVAPEPELCPSGYPEVGGECPVCPSGFKPDGTCVDVIPPDQCPEGQTKIGQVNGYAACAGTCEDPNQSWGFVNGIEGCYGTPSCPAGGSYGYVNGVGGCYGSDSSSGSNTSSGSGASAGSNTSSGSGGGGGSAGSNTSSGSGGDDTGGGSTGGGGGPGGGNNSIGNPYPQEVACPSGFEKAGDKCVSTGRGDCPVGYHELVVSQDPFLFVCVQDNPPPSSSSSSQPQSSRASSQSSTSSSNVNIGGGSASSLSTGGASSVSGGDSGGNSSAGGVSGGGTCEEGQKPQCLSGDIQCAQLIQQWHTRCGGELPVDFFDLPDEGDQKASFSKSLTNFKVELEKLPNTQIIDNFFSFNGSSSCPVWQVTAWVFNVVIDQQCSPNIPWSLISGILIAVSVLLAARIALT